MVLVLAAGCSKDLTKDLAKLADRACACTDAECGRKVIADLHALKKENENATGDEDTVRKEAVRLGECIVKSGVPADEAMKAFEAL